MQRHTGYSGSHIDVNRPTPRSERTLGARLQNIEAVREKLLEEIVMLESRMEQVKAAGSPMDFSLIQTYREMIHSRKQLFLDLSR